MVVAEMVVLEVGVLMLKGVAAAVHVVVVVVVVVVAVHVAKVVLMHALLQLRVAAVWVLGMLLVRSSALASHRSLSLLPSLRLLALLRLRLLLALLP